MKKRPVKDRRPSAERTTPPRREESAESPRRHVIGEDAPVQGVLYEPRPQRPSAPRPPATRPPATRQPASRGPAGSKPKPAAGRAKPHPGKRPRRKPLPAKPPGMTREDGRERLHKILATAGVASRRECEQLIADGRVEVDNVVVTELGMRVNPQEQMIHLDGEPLIKQRMVYFAVHKPEGVVTTSRDQAGRPRVTDLVPPSAGRVFAVGRLDMPSEGLIILTNDGELANKLTHPRHGVEKTYHVQVAGMPEFTITQQLTRGVHIAEGRVKAVRATIKGQRKKSTILEVVLNEGKNREIRRLLAKLGHKVQRLVRVAVGPVKLGDMPAGAYRPLTPQEVKALHRVGDGLPARPTGKPGSPAGGKKLRRRKPRKPGRKP